MPKMSVCSPWLDPRTNQKRPTAWGAAHNHCWGVPCADVSGVGFSRAAGSPHCAIMPQFQHGMHTMHGDLGRPGLGRLQLPFCWVTRILAVDPFILCVTCLRGILQPPRHTIKNKYVWVAESIAYSHPDIQLNLRTFPRKHQKALKKTSGRL